MKVCLAFWTIFILVGCAGGGGPPATEKASSQQGDVRIVRGAFGVPHIYADDNFGLFYGYGYAVAQDRLFQMEMLKRTTQGTVSEVLGAQYLDVDKLVRTGFDPKSIRSQLKKLRRKDAAVFEGYALGMNAWLDEINSNPDKLLPAEFSNYDFAPSRWTAYDVVMCFVGSIIHRYADFNEELMNLNFVTDLTSMHGAQTAADIFEATLPLYDLQSPTTVPPPAEVAHSKVEHKRVIRADSRPLTTPIKVPTRLALDRHGQLLNLPEAQTRACLEAELARTGLPGMAGRSSASNVWLVSKDRLLDASGALVNGPQFGWSTPSYVYGVGLHGAGFDVVGNTLLAFPFLLFAHNGQLAWGSTAGFGDLVDLYELRLNPEDPEEYWYKGRYRNLDKRVETILVRDAAPVELVIYTSRYGPVIAQDSAAGVAYSKNRTWSGFEVETGVSWVNLAKAKTFEDARSYLSGVAANINFYYLNSEGRIGYTHAGRYPVRTPDHDNRLPARGDGSMDWQSIAPFESNPYVHDPATGFITNWNNRPAADWPNPDLWWRRWSRASRVTVLNDAIQARPKWGAESLWEINREASHADLNLRFLLPYLQKAMDAGEAASLEQSALASLEQWDGQWQDRDADGHFDGAGPVIMQSWLTRLAQAVLEDDLGPEHYARYASPGYPVDSIAAAVAISPGIKAIVANLDQLSDGVPVHDFFNGADAATLLAETFAQAVNDLVEQQGGDLGQWQLDAHPLVFRTFNFRGVPQADQLHEQVLPVIMNRGSENNVFIARDGGITGRDVVAPGQSGFASADGTTSPHYADQLQLYQNFGLKPLPLTTHEVEAAGTSVTELTIGRADR